MSRVFLTDLDDFIVPSQACVNPYVAPNLTPAKHHSSQASKNTKKHGRVTLETDFSTSEFNDTPSIEPDLIRHRVGEANKKVAAVSLNDCLACSGCVTTAEAILIQEQSSDKFLQILNQSKDKKDYYVVVQISPNSRASIAEFLGMDPHELFLKISTMLKSLGVKYVLDSSAGGDVALVESGEELLQRYNSNQISFILFY